MVLAIVQYAIVLLWQRGRQWGIVRLNFGRELDNGGEVDSRRVGVADFHAPQGNNIHSYLYLRWQFINWLLDDGMHTANFYMQHGIQFLKNLR